MITPMTAQPPRDGESTKRYQEQTPNLVILASYMGGEIQDNFAKQRFDYGPQREPLRMESQIAEKQKRVPPYNIKEIAYASKDLRNITELDFAYKKSINYGKAA
jgi:hypothetical protein